MHIPFDREKYLAILRKDGAPAALTVLQQDTQRWEYQAFEGSQGWQPEMWKELDEVRSFSREIWNFAMAHPEKSG